MAKTTQTSSQNIKELLAIAAKAGLSLSRRWLGKAVLLYDKLKARKEGRDIKSAGDQYLLPLEEKPARIARELYLRLQDAQDLKAAAREVTAVIKIPQPQNPQPLVDISQQINDISVALHKIVLKSAQNRASTDIKTEVKKHISEKSKEQIKKAKDHLLHEIHHTTHQAAQHAANVADLADAATTPDNVGEVAKHATFADDMLVHTLDQAGIIGDLAKVQDSLIEAFPMGAVVADGLADLAIIPGLFSSGQTILREIELIRNKETTFEDSFETVGIPLLIKAGVMGAAATLEVATGGAFFGLILLAAGIYTTFSGKKAIKEQALAQWKELDGYRQQIQGQKKTAAIAINASVAKNFAPLPDLVKACPALEEHPGLRVFFSGIAAAYNVESHHACEHVRQAAKSRIETLPLPNVIDHVLKIDRSAARRGFYQSAADRAINQLTQKAQHFSKTADSDFAAAAALVCDARIVPNGPVAQQIAALDLDLPQIIGLYKADVSAWQKQCLDEWKKATGAIEEVTGAQSKLVAKLASDLEPKMAPLREKLRANMKRLGQEINIPD